MQFLPLRVMQGLIKRAEEILAAYLTLILTLILKVVCVDYR